MGDGNALRECWRSPSAARLRRGLEPKEEAMPARCDYDGRRGGYDNYAGRGIGAIVVRGRTGIIDVKVVVVVVAVVAAVIDVGPVAISVRRRCGGGDGGDGHGSEKNFMDGFH